MDKKMYNLTEGALDQITNGIQVENPILQILGHRKLTGAQERYRLLVSDGVRLNSFAMLATQLNSLISDNILTEFSVCQINRFAISTVNNSGNKKRVMVILNIDVKVPGHEVGERIGNPTQQDSAQQNGDSTSTTTRVVAKPAPKPASKTNGGHSNAASSSRLNDSVSSGSEIMTTPIAALSPYQNRWVIRARVTNKSDIRRWSNSRGEGHLFSMDLVDESGEIRCTGFKEQCDKFYDMIEFGKVYYISRCQLKPANKQFSNLKNEYEMTLTNDSEIVPCHDEADDIPTIQYDFSPISEIDSKNKDDIIDVLGICKSFTDVTTIVTRAARKELKKREINLVDESNTMVSFTMWGSQAEEFNPTNNPVIALKGARISEFNGGKSLSAISSTVVQIDPDIPEAHRLRGWYNTTGFSEEVRTISKGLTGGGGLNAPWLSFKEAKDLQLGTKDVADFFVIKATINMIRTENSLYKSCPTEDCKKKVVDQSNDMYRCEKCNREYPNFKYRLLAGVSLADWTDNQWATAFNEEGEKILGLSSQELGELKDNDNDTFLEKFGDAAFRSFLFKLRVKMETYGDEQKVKTTVAVVTPMDFKTYNAHLISQIRELANIGKA